VDVRCASSVVTREAACCQLTVQQLCHSYSRRVKLQDAVLVAELNSTEHGVVDVARIISVAVAASDHSTVHTRAVAVPRLKRDLRHRLTGPGVNYLNVKSQWYTGVAIGDILADIFTRDP
jgi:hypothetical protein